MKRRFFTLDVFTDTLLSGNPLAVVLDSDGLDDDRMQAIAGEFNLSETVFVFPPVDCDNRASIRIFTPGKELPFAGHPTVGTAVLLSNLDEGTGERTFILEEKVGFVKCQVSGNDARFDLPKLPERKQIEADYNLLADALGLKKTDIGFKGHSFALCDAGVPYPTLPLASLEALKSIRLNQALLTEYNLMNGLPDEIYVYAKLGPEHKADYAVRMFAPAMGIPEDPATGSAAASFASQIMACEIPDDGEHEYVLLQGVEMGRPSQIKLLMTIENGALVHAGISGSAVIASEGILNF